MDARTGHIVRASRLPLEAVNDIVPASKSVIVVKAWADGATLHNELFILNGATLRAIVSGSFTDSTFLGVIGGRIYIDDWCCNGRGDEHHEPHAASHARVESADPGRAVAHRAFAAN